MKHAFYSGISGKIASLFLLAFLIIILPLNAFVYFKLKSTLEEADNHQLKTENEKLLGQLSIDPPIIPLPPIGYYIKVQTTDGQFLNPIFESPGFPELADEFFFIENLDLDTLKIQTTTQAMEFGGGEVLMTIVRSNRPLHNQLADFRLYLFYVTGFAVLIIIVGVFAISGFMLRPVKKIIEASGRIASASGFQNLPIPKSKDESRELAMALNAMLERIRSSNDVQQKFFDSATHELKTPLSIMKAELSQALQAEEKGVLKNGLKNVLEEVDRLDRTISDFLLVSQLRSHMLSLNKVKLNLAEITYGALQSLRNFSAERDIKFTIKQTENTDFAILGDSDKLKIILLNIVENAIRYSPEGERVEVNLQQNGHEVSLQISNKAHFAIPQVDLLGKERFTNSSSARGMGLGLWICNQIMELHGASFTIENVDNNFVVSMAFRS